MEFVGGGNLPPYLLYFIHVANITIILFFKNPCNPWTKKRIDNSII